MANKPKPKSKAEVKKESFELILQIREVQDEIERRIEILKKRAKVYDRS